MVKSTYIDALSKTKKSALARIKKEQEQSWQKWHFRSQASLLCSATVLFDGILLLCEEFAKKGLESLRYGTIQHDMASLCDATMREHFNVLFSCDAHLAVLVQFFMDHGFTVVSHQCAGKSWDVDNSEWQFDYTKAFIIVSGW